MVKQNLIFLIIFIFSMSCNSDNYNSDNQESSSSSINDNEDENSSIIEDQKVEEEANGCKFEDGNYSASVDYYNPETNYSASYTLDVEVQDCQVVQINFPNDGYLDEDHISPSDIDEDGHSNVDGENGKTYEIQIEN